MTSYSLSNILLPAVFISSAVFSTLTVPFALIKSEPVAVEVPPFFSGEIQPIFNGEHKDVAIPYIGFAIVVSVGAGIATVEVSRRWQAYRESALTQ
ncbi:MAG TPA: TetR family transcriptional regulator, partial [Coleofasciculaceae cyanobacterium]